MIYARTGEPVTCENGHVVGHFVVDVLRGAPCRSRDFMLVDGGARPEAGSVMAPCAQCGASAFRGGPSIGMQAHFADGWRSFADEPEIAQFVGVSG